MSLTSPRRVDRKTGGRLLILTWLGLLGALAAAVGYVLVLPEAELTEGAPDPVAVVPLSPEPAARAARPGVSAPGRRTPGVLAPGVLAPGETPPWRRNAQAFDETDTRPRVAVVLTGLGLSTAATEAAITQLPAAVTLSFTPYARRLAHWMSLARAKGHEVMLDLPMEPTSYPDDDPGPHTLLTTSSAAQNLERLRWTLERARGYVGVAAVMGSRFSTSPDHLAPILEELKNRGLLYLDNRSSEYSLAGELAAKMGVPRAINERFLDRDEAGPVALDGRLVQLERIALAGGATVAMGRPLPVTIERLRAWSKDLESRGLVLAPISAVADRQRPGRSADGETQ